MRQIILTENLTNNLNKRRTVKFFSKERVEDLVEVFDISYSHFDGETVIKFYHVKRFCYISIECYPESIIIKAVSCSKNWEYKINHK